MVPALGSVPLCSMLCVAHSVSGGTTFGRPLSFVCLAHSKRKLLRRSEIVKNVAVLSTVTLDGTAVAFIRPRRRLPVTTILKHDHALVSRIGRLERNFREYAGATVVSSRDRRVYCCIWLGRALCAAPKHQCTTAVRRPPPPPHAAVFLDPFSLLYPPPPPPPIHHRLCVMIFCELFRSTASATSWR